MSIYKTADKAFYHLYDVISDNGIDYAKTKTLFNIGFYIKEPWNNKIKTKFREWKEDYAEAEWQWYLSGDRNVAKLGRLYGKVPAIWNFMVDDLGNCKLKLWVSMGKRISIR